MTGVSYSSIGWADYDNDGDLDLLITGQNKANTPISKIYRNEGNSSFTEQTGIVLKGINRSSVAWGDYDNDGYLDLLLSGLDQFSQNITRIYRNNGNNTFTEQTNIALAGVSFSSVAWGDYNNDNNLDILITGATGYTPNYYPVTKIYRNNGNNTFTELTGLNVTGIYNGAAEWGDYNNDGLLDVLTIGDSGVNFEFRIYLNNGQNGFRQLTSLNLPGAIACSSSSADYDSDGDLDIVFAGYSGALLAEIYRNNLYMMAGKIKPNMRPEAPTGLQSEVTPGTLKLSWSGVKTDETFFVNMSYNIRCKLANDPFWKVAPQSSVDGYRSLNDLGNAQLNKNYTIKNPESGKYYWQVQAVDQSFSGSEWSKLDSVTIKNTQAFFKTDTVCFNLQTHFTDQSKATDGISAWKWDFKDGSTSTQQNPVHTYLASGTYNVKLTITSTTGVKDSVHQDVIVKAKPVASFTAPNVCIGLPTVLTNTTNKNGLTISVWNWTFGDGASSGLEQPGTHTFPVRGTYQTKLYAMASNGCADSVTNNVIVAGYPSSSLSVSGKLSFCSGDSIQLTAEYDPNYSYVWKLDNNDLTNTNSNNFKVKQFSGIYSARITNNLANCETNSEQKTVTINTTPTKPKIVSDNYGDGECFPGTAIKIYIDQPVAEYNYRWYRNENLISDATSGSLEGFLKDGSYRVDADLNGCVAKSSTFTVSYTGGPPKPTIFAQGPSVWVLFCSEQNESKYQWYFNGGLIQGAVNNKYVAGSALGKYFVVVGNNQGCFTPSDEISIPSGTTGIENTDPFAGIKIYPNPTSGLLKFEMDNQISGEIHLSVVSQNGKEIMNVRFDKRTEHHSGQVDISGNPKGIYFIKISTDKYSVNRKIILE
jgi:PKD repeat protein